MKTAGKTLTIFLVVIVILLLCLNAITLYLNQKETEQRKTDSQKLGQLINSEAKLQAELKEAKQQVFLLQEKNKEADERINDLMDNLELEQGLREQVKQENQTLKETLDNENQSKDQLRSEYTEQLNASKEKAAKIETQLSEAQKKVQELETQSQQLKNKIKELEAEFDKKIESEAFVPKTSSANSAEAAEIDSPAANSVENADKNEVQLDPIVVAPVATEGRVLSVDKDNEFLIFNLGERHGVVSGTMMSVYRGSDYLGDVKVSRVQSEMSAADFIPPFSSQKVRKNDQVVAKK